MSERFPAAHRRRVSLVALITALIGFILLALTIRRVGWADVVAGIASVGWAFLVVILLGAVRVALRARAWIICVASADGTPDRALSFTTAFNAVLAADALGNVTPFGLLASEPAKMLMVRSHLSAVTSIASVAIENACYTVSVLAVLLTGTWLFSERADLPQPLVQAAEVVVVGAAIATVATIWAARTRPAILSRLAPLLARVGGRADVPADKLREVETRVYDAVHWPVSRLAHIGFWEALFHVCAIAEVWLVLRLLPGGDATTFQDAFLMESAGRFVTVVFKFIPFRLGVDEAGSGLVAQVVGIPAVAGVTLALVRRLRIFVLNAAGFAVLLRRN